MDNLAPSYLHGPIDSEAQHRLDKLLLVGDPQFFPTSGSSVQFSRLNGNREIVTIDCLCAVRQHSYTRARGRVMSQRDSALVAEAKQHVLLPPARKDETARRVRGVSNSARDCNRRKSPLVRLRISFAGQISEQAQTMRAEIERVARKPFNILITGETGTGKTYAAREIHRLSTRANNPFMELNSANLPEHLVEAELFGYRKGAFTGADRDHIGLFEEANGGILFLDEIGDIAPTVQNKLLRAIEEKQIKRLGSNRYLFCDVQIIAATSRNLPTMIQRREFREDLYSRLAVLTIETTPLRERREDIPAMIALFLREAANAVAGRAKQCETLFH